MPKHNPRRDPKFQKELIFPGDGKSTKAEEMIFNKGFDFKWEIILL